jgi:hypothetical protein
MRSQLFIPFILLNVLFQATACSQQPAVNAGVATAQSETIKKLPESQPTTKAATNDQQPVIKADATDERPLTRQILLPTGVYNSGSRYITIAAKGDRTCYQGVSIPSGRYAVAVGETTGSLSAEKDYFVADGWKKYGRNVTLSQNGENLSISMDGGSPSEYNFYQKGDRDKYSESLINCLNSTGEFFETAPSYTISTTTASQSKKETGNLLTSEQKTLLLQLPIPIVAPTFLPDGFRLVYANGEASKYANGDDDSGYTIAYQGENNTCISMSFSSSGTRGLQRANEVKTEFGSVVVYTDNARDNSIKSISSFFVLKGSPMLISGGSIPDRSADGGFKRCQPVEMGVYIQVLKSVTLVK